MLRRSTAFLLILFALPLLAGEVSGTGSALPLTVSPAFFSVTVEPRAAVEREVTLSLAATATAPATVVAALSDCACLRVLTPLPFTVAPDKPVTVRLRITGVRAGVETVTFTTSLGPVTAAVQVVSAGLGEGAAALAAMLAQARQSAASPWFIVHDLKGQLRNCGCSQGALGGIEHLAALPAQVKRLAPTLKPRFLLSGDSDGARPGVAAALTAQGWERDDAAVVVGADPAAAIAKPGVVVVIPTVAQAPNHRAILRPVLSGGLVVEVVQVNAQRQVVAQATIPVDRTLEADPGILARFPEPLTATLRPEVKPAGTCVGCHAAAAAVWERSAHARAWNSLKPADRVDACVDCHATAQPGTTALPGKATPRELAPHVACQACHVGADAHAAAPTTVKAGRAVACLTCHDAKHAPRFDRDAAWKTVMHGR